MLNLKWLNLKYTANQGREETTTTSTIFVEMKVLLKPTL